MGRTRASILIDKYLVVVLIVDYIEVEFMFIGPVLPQT